MNKNDFDPKITKEELMKPKYVSRVEEFRRHTRIKRHIRVFYKDNKLLFNDLMKVLRKYYKAPNKDFSKIGSKFMINKINFKVISYKPGKMFEIEAMAKGQLYNVKYVIKRFFNLYSVHYYDYSLSQKTSYGLLANVAKFFYKRQVSKNARMIKKDLKTFKKGQK